METLTTLERAIRLQKVELFSDLETDLLALIASVASQLEAKKGETLFEENRPLPALLCRAGGPYGDEPRRASDVHGRSR